VYKMQTGQISRTSISPIDIDIHKSILIIGEGDSTNKLNKIEYASNIARVESMYGSSDLTDAYKYLASQNIKQIFLINAKQELNYVTAVDIARQYPFAYIVPINIKFSDSFFNFELKRKMMYSELYMRAIGPLNSNIVMTDVHADLYTDMDHFIKDYGDKISRFNNKAYEYLKYGRNIILVGNNLKDHKFANLALVAAIVNNEIGAYPLYTYGEAIFEIGTNDVKNDFVFFKNNTIRETTAENLKNLRYENDAAKLIMIDQVIKYIDKEKDFSEFKGKKYTEMIRMQIMTDMNTFLSSLINTIIRGYKINSVICEREQGYTAKIIIDFNVLPMNSIEEYSARIEA